ncbi:MAG: aspartate/glutamate racemase family protein [Sphaerochaetaceae bacterium]|nr:aspartate/glutamate racemase family protein [Sphaerochaetaceae bacterium]MDC7246940.1 aspartate/glutamate racemase family protein [Sphaerochaetaceae bacterium]
MRKIVLLHTVRSVYETFEHSLREYLPFEVEIHNMVDEFLANGPALNNGTFTKNDYTRLVYDMLSAQSAHPDVIVVTCSSLTPYVTQLRSIISTPIIAIDDEMCRQAVSLGSDICVLATAESTVKPTVSKITEEAQKAGKDVNISSYCAPDAIVALKKGDIETHDRLLLELAKSKVKDFDVVVLSQASMAAMRENIEKEVSVQTLSSPLMCMKAVKEFLEDM